MSGRICAGGCGRQVVPHRTPLDQRPPGAITHAGRGLCSTCRDRAIRAGTLSDHKRIQRTSDEVMQAWADLRQHGLNKRQAAAHIGMNYLSFDRAYYRARVAGDPRAR